MGENKFLECPTTAKNEQRAKNAISSVLVMVAWFGLLMGVVEGVASLLVQISVAGIERHQVPFASGTLRLAGRSARVAKFD